MSAENKPLEDLVRDWAGNDSDRARRWRTELHKNDADDIRSLVKVARSSAWKDFLKLISPVLRANLEDWAENILEKRRKTTKRPFEEGEYDDASKC